MSKFNANVKPSRTKSFEGANNYTKNPVEEWMNFLFSSKMDNKFYESDATQQDRFKGLTRDIIDTYGPTFAAKCAFFARNALGMRSASQFVAAMLNSEKFDGKRNFYKKFMHRADDPAEIFAAVDSLGGKRSHALVRGAGDYLSSLGDYQIAKYKMNGKAYNMYDLINITHANSETIDKYKKGTLAAPETWEVGISTGTTNWKELVEGKKLGYLALIRNLNNILNSDVDNVWVKQNLVDQIINEVSIRKSLVFPYQIYNAYRNLQVQNMAVVTALDDAFRIACGNMPTLEGTSVIILDVSCSMDSRYGERSNLTIKEVGACYAAALYINGNCDFVKFGNEAISKTFAKASGPFQIITQMCANEGCGYGTCINSAFKVIGDKNYDRIFVVSDMQTMSTDLWANSGIDNYNDYVRAHDRTVLYSFDLGNYHSQIANPGNPDVHLMTALNDNIFKMLQFVEEGGKLVDYIDENYTI